MSINRRTFLGGSLGAALAAAGSLGVAQAEPAGAAQAEPAGGASRAPVDPTTIAVPFLGANQAGIYRPAAPQPAATFAAFRVLSRDAGELRDLLRTLTDRIRSLSEGVPAPESAAPGGDSGVLGSQPAPDQLTVTVGLGSGLFTDKFGLAGKKPRGLTPMRVFPNDTPDPEWTGGDLILQLCSLSPDAVHHALREISRATRSQLQLEWKITGFHSGPRPTGAPRNLFGHKDGTVNPAEDENLVWITPDSGQPDWAVGGTFMVVRLIRMLVESWDRTGIAEQNAIIGRDRDTGAPLDGVTETDVPDYAADPAGRLIPLNAHIRLANPRTPATDRSRLLRRGYNYEMAGMDRNGNCAAGLIFCSFQQNITDQFEATQLRLQDEPLTEYVQPFGGGYFMVLPGVPDAGGYLGEPLFG